jgi:L-seryl-tRNA(Ser) seleniumtransferase
MKLSCIPSIDFLLNHEKAKKLASRYSRPVVKKICHELVARLRQEVRTGKTGEDMSKERAAEFILSTAAGELRRLSEPSLKPVINATGIILHTGLGRAPLSAAARIHVAEVMKGYADLEIDLRTGKRGERTDHVAELLCRLTGAEAAAVVNNNAAAVLLVLNTICFAREAVISRGQLIEIGGSFRLPQVMEKSGVVMREVGTTNKTRIADYRDAIGEKTGAVIVAHTSNYRVLGFTADVPLKDLVELAHSRALPLYHDLGGGVVVDLQTFGLPYEPLVQDSLAAGVDIVSFSGDKVLGGPQCGIILGSEEWIRRIHANPLMRAVRCGKLTYAALESTLQLFFRQKTFIREHRTMRMLTESVKKVESRVKKTIKKLGPRVEEVFDIACEPCFGQTGSGTLPLEKIPSRALTLVPKSGDTENLARTFLRNDPPVIGYINREKFFLDFRTVGDEELEELAVAINRVADKKKK